MANSRTDRAAASLASVPSTKKPVRRDATAGPRPDAKPKAAVISRANEIVRAIGLRPITGLSGPKIGY
ncbi:hypothetical protein [Paracoccus rhizosphaerae]|uniref:Uncharacterized protein n=1 Tax=Paracoccus rhizosphaerae TaxID=1133347 RepID=A0ABV6CEZ2_9RHOB|nr:hypothetical protein [Paracoccus rhizosphaerae]